MAGLDTLISASLDPGGRETDKGWVSVATFARDTNGTPEGASAAGASLFNDVFGPPLLVLRAEAPQAGRYRIFVDALTGPASAMLQLRVNDRPLSIPADFYTPEPGRSGLVSLGEVSLQEGENALYLTMPGRNPASNGALVDLIAIEGRLAGGD